MFWSDFGATLLHSLLYTCACMCIYVGVCKGAVLCRLVQQWSWWIIGIMVRLSAFWADPRAARKWEREMEGLSVMTERLNTYIRGGGGLFMSLWVGIWIFWCVCYFVYVCVELSVVSTLECAGTGTISGAHVHRWKCVCTYVFVWLQKCAARKKKVYYEHRQITKFYPAASWKPPQ